MSKMFDVVTETWNPVTGCQHNCLYCWARNLVETRLRNTKKYRYGFSPMIHEREFRKRFNGGTIFVCDMGDLFGDFIPSEWILRVINHVRMFPDTTFLFLTKNPARYFEFLNVMPSNVVLGATIETNRDDMYIEHNISRAPLPSSRYKAMKELKWRRKFVSIEPILDFDIDELVRWIYEIRPCIVYIGYDNYNNRLTEPPLDKTLELIDRLSRFTEVKRKTIRKAWYE